MTLEQWAREKKKLDPDNVLAPEMEPGEAACILAQEVLGPDWFVIYSCNGKQALAEAVAATVEKIRELRKPWWRAIP